MSRTPWTPIKTHLLEKAKRDEQAEWAKYENMTLSPQSKANIHHKAHTGLRIYHYHTDHLGRPQELTNARGEVVWLNYQMAWGGSFSQLNNVYNLDGLDVSADELQPFRFQGQFYDVETGLHYNRFRYYDSDVGMFISRDPIGLLGGSNVFAYAPNPVIWIDPWGLSRCLGLPSTRKDGGTGNKYDNVKGQGLYVLVDSKNNVKYVGRGDAPARGIAHKNSDDKGHLKQVILSNNNLTKAEAKYLEQRLMDKFGGAKSTNPLTNLLNKIRSYSPSNPNSPKYDIAGDSKAWGNEIFNDVLAKIPK